MDFTVIIPSRNRPVLLRKAIDSVLMQTHPSVEILVVNDGSDGENEEAYNALAAELHNKVRVINLEKARHGHGPSYAINRGADQAQGDFLCFLDDDDCWIDPQHLTRAIGAMSSNTVNLYLSNQIAYSGDRPVNGQLWLQPIADVISRKYAADTQGIYAVTVSDLTACNSFPHLNNTIVRKSLYQAIGGMDEGMRYECEWDLYFRILDQARGIRYFPGIVSRHNVPDRTAQSNVSTSVSTMQKLLSRLLVMDKALLFTHTLTLHNAAKLTRGHTLKHIASTLAQDGNLRLSFYYARAALAAQFGFKWFGYCVYLGFRAVFSKP